MKQETHRPHDFYLEEWLDLGFRCRKRLESSSYLWLPTNWTPLKGRVESSAAFRAIRHKDKRRPAKRSPIKLCPVFKFDMALR